MQHDEVRPLWVQSDYETVLAAVCVQHAVLWVYPLHFWVHTFMLVYSTLGNYKN